ncbi:MAG: hypothetical protein AB4058_21990 [Microcystaceae cyanobacterium]
MAQTLLQLTLILLLGILSGVFNLLDSLHKLDQKTRRFRYPFFKPFTYPVFYFWLIFQIILPGFSFILIFSIPHQSFIELTSESSLTLATILNAINYPLFFQFCIYSIIFGFTFTALINYIDFPSVKIIFDAVNIILYRQIARRELQSSNEFLREFKEQLIRLNKADLNKGIDDLDSYFQRDVSLSSEEKSFYAQQIKEIRQINFYLKQSEKVKKIISIWDIRSKDYPTLLKSFNLPQDFIDKYFSKLR